MIHRSRKGFTLIELMIVISIILVLMALVVVVGPPIFEQLRDMSCKNNLKQIYSALTLYVNKFGGYPDEDGDRFVAMLYYTGLLTKKEMFLCPEDAIKNNARWVDSGPGRTDLKFRYAGEGTAIDPVTGTIYKDRGDWSENYFEPWEISYAGRRNRQTGNAASDFYIKNPPAVPTPIVADDSEKESGEADDVPIHKDHINVLFSSGDVKSMQAIAGRRLGGGDEEKNLEALAN